MQKVKEKMTDSDMEILLSSEENQDDAQKSIVVPIDDDLDTVYKNKVIAFN